MSKRAFFDSPEGEESKYNYHSRLEKTVDRILSPFQSYIQSQATAGIVLFVALLFALVWSLLPQFSHYYFEFVNMPMGAHIGSFQVSDTFKFWVNDFLLTLFFFFVGLEIKREFSVGELSDFKASFFVICSAVGGATVPIILYSILTAHTAVAHAWGIPVATDTAFTLGVLMFFRKHLPGSLFTFIAALAIVDDIIAMLVIAIFYSPNLNFAILFIVLGLCCVVLFFNLAGFRRPLPYIIFSVLIWTFMELAGVHGTLVGILIAFLVPARPAKGPNQLIQKLRTLLVYFEKKKDEQPYILSDPSQHRLLEEVQEVAKQATTPLQRWEGKLERPVTLLVLPLFALVNVGMSFQSGLSSAIFFSPLFLGIFFGLVLGKPFGIFIAAFTSVKTGIARLPVAMNFKHVVIVALFSGIGFTMSLFVANLALPQDYLSIAKLSIMLSSLTAMLLAVGTMLVFIKRHKIL